MNMNLKTSRILRDISEITGISAVKYNMDELETKLNKLPASLVPDTLDEFQGQELDIILGDLTNFLMKINNIK
jgi:hypothetical protein